MTQRSRTWIGLLGCVAAAACAPTIGPATPPVEVIVVLDSLEQNLRIIPVDSLDVVHVVSLGAPGSVATALAVRGELAVVGVSDTVPSLLTIDLALRKSVCTPRQLAASPVGALAIGDTNAVYAGQPGINRVTTYTADGSCGVTTNNVRGGPQGFAFARGAAFVVAGNRQRCVPISLLCDELPGWVTHDVDQPTSLLPLLSDDSIPLLGPGNSHGGVLGSDGLLYFISSGDGNANGTLNQVDPLPPHRSGSFSGFGRLPEYLATDGGDHVYVASPIEGLMVFNVRTHQVERDASMPIPLSAPRGLATDDFGRLYVLQSPACSVTGGTGSVRVFGTDLVEQRGVTVGRCPIAIGITEIPASLYHFD